MQLWPSNLRYESNALESVHYKFTKRLIGGRGKATANSSSSLTYYLCSRRNRNKIC